MNIHDAAKLEQKEEILAAYQKYIGRYIFCRAKEDDTTRLFVDSMSDSINIITRGGWFDTFTIVDKEKPLKKGLYLCKLESFWLDKQGFVVSKVVPVVEIPAGDIASGKHFLHLFHMTDLFPDYYHLELTGGRRYNIDALYEGYDAEYQEYYSKLQPSQQQNIKHYLFARMIFSMFLAGKITVGQINAYLDTPYQMEVLAADIQTRFYTYYKEKYPVFCSEIKRKNIRLYDDTDIIFYLEDRMAVYQKMVDDGRMQPEEDIIRQVELIREYYQERKKNRPSKKKKKKE